MEVLRGKLQGIGFSEHNGIKLEVINRKIGKSLNTWKLNKTSLIRASKRKSQGNKIFGTK